MSRLFRCCRPQMSVAPISEKEISLANLQIELKYLKLKRKDCFKKMNDNECAKFFNCFSWLEIKYEQRQEQLAKTYEKLRRKIEQVEFLMKKIMEEKSHEIPSDFKLR